MVAARFQHRLQRRLCPVPCRIGTDALVGTQRQHIALGVEAEHVVALGQHVDEAVHLICHLVRSAEDVRVILREGTHASQTLRDTRQLVTMQPAEIRISDRQIAVRVQRLAIHDGVRRAVHRLDAILLLIDLEHVHAVYVVVVMPRSLEQVGLEHLRRDDLVVTVAAVELPDILNERVVYECAFGQEERIGRRDRIEEVEPHARTEAAMVSPLCLFTPLEVITHSLARLPSRAVDALQHGVRFTASPVRPGGSEQLECPDLARGPDMPSAAQVLKPAVRVAAERHTLAVGDAVENLQLVGIVRH